MADGEWDGACGIGTRSGADAELVAAMCARTPQADGACAAQAPALSKADRASSQTWDSLTSQGVCWMGSAWYVVLIGTVTISE